MLKPRWGDSTPRASDPIYPVHAEVGVSSGFPVNAAAGRCGARYYFVTSLLSTCCDLTTIEQNLNCSCNLPSLPSWTVTLAPSPFHCMPVPPGIPGFLNSYLASGPRHVPLHFPGTVYPLGCMGYFSSKFRSLFKCLYLQKNILRHPI